ncbi:MAG TPA: SUMF1/EgtB/PvdO family nonheme iron enzyme, partial [Polyangiaceae bacterium]
MIATATIGGCFVSFDGYQLGETAGDAGAAARAGSTGQHAGATSVAAGGEAGAMSNGGTADGAGGPNGGASASGGGNSAGAPHGGASAGGSANGGAPNGGASIGGSASGGAPNGGAPNGGAPNGGAPNGGAGGVMHCPAGTTNRASQEVPLPGGGFYCIDHAEIRNIDYKAFVDAQASTNGQVAACAQNTSYLPDTTGACNQYDPANKPDLPIACVDWCDAAAFCKWDGKHLCGKLGGGSNLPADFADASKSA